MEKPRVIIATDIRGLAEVDDSCAVFATLSQLDKLDIRGWIISRPAGDKTPRENRVHMPTKETWGNLLEMVK